jgi:hypothetical protein
LRIAQWRLALARQESQINPGHLEAENSRSHPEHRMAGSVYGSWVAHQLDPGGTLRSFRPFVKGRALSQSKSPKLVAERAGPRLSLRNRIEPRLSTSASGVGEKAQGEI